MSTSTSGCAGASAGIETRALARASHAEGIRTTVEDEAAYGKHAECGHAEGLDTRATGWSAHAEGSLSWAEALISHAQNCITLAAGNDSHAEGVQTVTGRRRYFVRADDQGVAECVPLGVKPWIRLRADPALCPGGDYTREFPDQPVDPLHGVATVSPMAHSSTWWRHNTAILFCTREGPPLLKVRILRSFYEPEGQWTTIFYDHEGEPFPVPDRIMMVCASYCPEGADTTYSDGKGQHAEGKRTNAAGNFAHAEGRDTTCFGRYSHAEGYRTAATGQFGSHAEGHRTVASGHFSHAEGNGAWATGNASHAEGCDTLAGGEAAHASGLETEASGSHSMAVGRSTQALHPGAVVMGRYGASTGSYAWHLAGGSVGNPVIRARIDAEGGYHAGRWASGGSGFADWFEWEDGFVGDGRDYLFVSLRGDRLVLAESAADYLLGIVTPTPAFMGGDGSGDTRKNGSPVALVGRVVARDNGQCGPNGYCRPGPGGVAVPAPTGLRVLRRLATNRIELVLK